MISPTATDNINGVGVGVSVGFSVGVGVGTGVGAGVTVGDGVIVSVCESSVKELIQGAGHPQPPQKFPVFPVLPHSWQSQEYDSADAANVKMNSTKSMTTDIVFLTN